MKLTNEPEKLLQATDDELDAMQYITASKIIHLKNKYKDPELRILWERQYAKRMIQSMQDKLNVYEHGYKYSLRIMIGLGLFAAFTGWIWDFTMSFSSTFIFSIASFLLFNLYCYGKTICLFKWGDAYKDDREEDMEEGVLEHYEPTQNEEEGQWIPVKELSEKLLVDTAVIGKILKKHGFLKRRNAKGTLFLAKKVLKFEK